MDKLQAMTVFVRVVEAGSFVGAAERLGLSTSVVSRLVSDLESQLEARLLQRTTRRLALTDAGRSYLARCQQILADIAEAESEIGSHEAEPTGTLRFTAPVSLGTRHLAALLPQFCARYPQVQLDISLADRSVDLVEEGWIWPAHCRANARIVCGAQDYAHPHRHLRRARLSDAARHANYPGGIACASRIDL